MATEQPVSRRTALKAIASATLVGASMSTATATERESGASEVGSVQTESAALDSTQGKRSEPPTIEQSELNNTGRTELRRLTGSYGGTVDRIVDGEHVVILIESGGQVIEQVVVSSDTYPRLDEGDSVSVLFMWGRVIAIW